MSALFYYTGMMVWVGLVVVVVPYAVILIWDYFSIAITYWWVRVAADIQYPNDSSIKKEFKQRKFWKARLLIVIIRDYETVIGLSGSKVNGAYWSADYTRRIPKVRVERYS